jgi:hypothetical protein
MAEHVRTSTALASGLAFVVVGYAVELKTGDIITL